MNNSRIPIKLFISYSHDDEDYFKVFSYGLKKVVINSQLFDWNIWDDTNIHVGTFWDDEIQNNIKNCDVALLLCSIGFMSSNYIKEKEFNEFKKKHAENGILIFPIVFKPCDFNAWEDLGKLQFFKPNGSNYNKADVENFTYADLIKFAETNGVLIPNPNLDRYHLDLFKRIEESYIEFNKRNNATSLNYKVVVETINSNKLSDYPKPSVLFTGRSRELYEIETAFNTFNVFAIEGLGGTGKTQVVSKFIEECILEKEKIIWLNGSSQSNFDIFIENSGLVMYLKLIKILV